MYSQNNFKLPGKRVNIKKMLEDMPEIKAKPGFDQKMAALFAMELDKEIQQRNISWLKKSNRIKLPDVIS